MHVEVIDLADTRWGTYVSAHPEATIFHHPAWSQLLADCYGYSPFVACAVNGAGAILGGMPLMEVSSWLTGSRWISLPFSDYCPPLYTDRTALEGLVDYLMGLCTCGTVPRIQIRWQLAGRSGINLDKTWGLHVLRLSSDAQVVFKAFSKKFRQYPRKAEREGMYIRISGTQRDIDIFYDLHLKTRVKLGVPVQPKRYFRLLWERLIQTGHGVVFLAYLRNTPVAGAVVLTHRTRAMIKCSASDPAYLPLRSHYFIFWKCIEWACEHGMTSIDFGKTKLSNEGLRQFKDGWGAQELPLAYSWLGIAPSTPMPEKADKTLTWVIRRSPSAVCRLIGELLYGHFA